MNQSIETDIELGVRIRRQDVKTVITIPYVLIVKFRDGR